MIRIIIKLQNIKLKQSYRFGKYKINFQNDYNQIIRLILYCYYSDKDVLGKLNLKNDPPFPDGNKIRKGDLTLLKQVLDKKISFRS